MRDPKLDSGSGGSSSGGSSSSDSSRRDWSQPTDVITGSANNTGSGDGGEDRSGFDAWRQTETEQRQDLDSHEQNECQTTAIPGTGGQYSVCATDDEADRMAYGEGGHDNNPNVGDGHDPTQGGDKGDTTGGDHPVLNEDGQDIYNETTEIVNKTVEEAAPEMPEVPSADDLLPDWLPWAAGGVVGLLALMVFSYTVGQLFDIQV